MMNFILVKGRIKAIEAIHLGTGISVGTFMETKDYITAKALRGMLGNYLYNENKRLFDESRISDDTEPTMFFKPALPYGQSAVPNNVRWCKKCGHLFSDDIKACPDCGHEGKKRTGWFTLEPNSTLPQKIEEIGVKKTISTKCPINPQRHSSYLPEDENKKTPYNIEAILPGTEFSFSIVMEDKHSEEIKSAMKEAGIFYGVGGFRSKGYGSIDVEFTKEMPIEDYISQRTETLANKGIMVANTEVLLRGEDGYFRYFEESAIRRYVEGMNKLLPFSVPTDFRVESQPSANPSSARGWDMKNGYRLMNIRPAIGSGSSAVVVADPQLMASIELFGLGEDHHIFGDVYFLKEAAL